jgi:hypothetical protein
MVCTLVPCGDRHGGRHRFSAGMFVCRKKASVDRQGYSRWSTMLDKQLIELVEFLIELVEIDQTYPDFRF